jgi:hypothetical protein
MLPLILLALGLGAALTAYELSPNVRDRVDYYARALRDAHAAHSAADAHLDHAGVAMVAAVQHAHASAMHQSAAQPSVPVLTPLPPRPAPMPSPPMPSPPMPSPPMPAPMPAPMPLPPAPMTMSPGPSDHVLSATSQSPAQDLADLHASASQAAADAASDHVAVATEQNQAAAQSTADAAKSAKTAAERQAAADSAARVLEREKKIAAALASLGIGQCGLRTFKSVTAQVKDALLGRLHAEGMTVTGSNPWNIDTGQYDVKLRAVWDPAAQVLRLIVTAGKDGYFGLVTCTEIWKKIDPIMKEVVG